MPMDLNKLSIVDDAFEKKGGKGSEITLLVINLLHEMSHFLPYFHKIYNIPARFISFLAASYHLVK